MVVEDEFFIRLDIAEVLRGAGYTVLEASTADDALALLRGEVRIDVIFTDIRMPGAIDGLDLAELVGREYPHIKLLITSAEKPRLDPVHPFLWKPYRHDDVLSSIGRSLGTLAR